ncbi:MAG: hypothetical protein KJO44_10890 [Gemmatimonadetes bacterium]|nr:hypothetical protein [Gemmatimonadota bacterium]
MAKKRAAKRKTAAKKKVAVEWQGGRLKALRSYRCGEPGTRFEPPEEIGQLMVETFGKHCRIFEGAIYGNFPENLATALLRDGAVEEVR